MVILSAEFSKYRRNVSLMKIKNMKLTREAEISIFLVFFSSLSGQLPQFYSAIYHDLFDSPVVVGSFAFIVAICLASFAYAISKYVKNPIGLRIIAYSVFSYSVYQAGLKSALKISKSPEKLILGFATVGLAFLLARYASHDRNRRVQQVCLTTSIFFILTTLFVGPIQRMELREHGKKGTFSLSKIMPEPPRATVILLLDELSPEVVDPIVLSLESVDRTLFSSPVAKAGKHTLNAVPSILSNKTHDDVAPCGATMLCGANPFSTGELKATYANTYVIGAYHPYCDIAGLKYCWRAISDDFVSDLGIAGLVKLLPVVGQFFNHTYSNEATLLRAKTEDQVLGAPFWENGGGLLFVHHMLPHPTGTGEARSLAIEYNQNVIAAAEFVNKVQQKLKTHFGNDFALIVISDHPLRSMWCEKSPYSGADCLKDTPAESDWVPFIVSAPKGTQVQMPSTMIGVLAE